MNARQRREWHLDRERQSKLGNPTPNHDWPRGRRFSRGEHCRRLNNGIALRTFRYIMWRSIDTGLDVAAHVVGRPSKAVSS